MKRSREKKTFKLSLVAPFISLVLLSAATSRALEDGYIAGTTPAIRPPGAPRIERVVHSKAWFEQTYKGIEKPYPPNLDFIEQQGAWYTPFNRPGMTGRYDIRGWYGKRD